MSTSKVTMKSDFGEPDLGLGGFTLVELLMALAIAGIIAAFAISISSSISGLSKQAMTKARMETIAAKARQYYRAHKAQVAAASTPAESVPVTSTSLNLEQKYRLDGWGKFLYYRVSASISDLQINSSSTKFGTIIISSGPNQQFDIENYKTDTNLKLKGDDIIVGVNYSQEATEITLEELQVLQSKVEAFDAQFEGVDNDGDDDVDENLCFPYKGVIDCYNGSSVSGAVDDPNCGRATLDEIENKTFTCDCNDDGVIGSNEYMNACCFIRKMYGLSLQYLTDPWGNPYLWSDATDPLKHHKFWSVGPDRKSGETAGDTDDDIVY